VEARRLAALERLHLEFVARHRDWTERVEVGYVGRAVLRTLAGTPEGTIAVISPGEPLNIKPIEWDWVLNWHGVRTRGEVVRGRLRRDLGPEISPAAFRRAVKEQLDAWPGYARQPSVAYVPAQQGYIVLTICRALHALETGEQTTKEGAAAWAADRFPDRADFIREALAAHRADYGAVHARVIEFVAFATGEAS